MKDQDEQSRPPSRRDVQDESVSLPQAEGATGDVGTNTSANTNVETNVDLSRSSNAVIDTCSPPATIDPQSDDNGHSTCAPPTTAATEVRSKLANLVLPKYPDEIETNVVQVELLPLPLLVERQIGLEWSAPEVLLDNKLPIAPKVSLIDKVPVVPIGKLPVASAGKVPVLSAGKHAIESYNPIWVPGILSASTAPGAADIATIAGSGTPPPAGPHASSLLVWMEFSAVGHSVVRPLSNLQLAPLPQLGGSGGGGPGGAHGTPVIDDVPDLESVDEEADEEVDEAPQKPELAEEPSTTPQ